MADPVESRPLGDQAYSAIRAEILDCVLWPGSLVTERALNDRFGLGLAAVRTALGRLTAERLVEPVRRVGYRITPITMRSITDFFDAWQIISPAIARLALTRMTEQHRAALEALNVPDVNSTAAELTAHAEAAWDIVVDAAGNAILDGIYRRLNVEMHRLFALAGEIPNPPRILFGSIQDLLAMSPDAAEQWARESLQEMHVVMAEWMQSMSMEVDGSVTSPRPTLETPTGARGRAV